MEDTLYIIEGPDGSGKSTLSKWLSEKKNIPVRHFTYYKDRQQMSNQFFEGHETLSLSEESMIFDRYILSNLVYGIVFHECNFVDGWLMWLSSMMSGVSVRKKIHIVFCLPEKEKWLKRFEELCKNREEMYVDVEKMSKVYDIFLIFFQMMCGNSDIKITCIDPFVENPEKILENEE